MISYTAIEQDGFIGKIVFGTTTLEWKYDSESRCCENFGVLFVPFDHNVLDKAIDKFDLFADKITIDKTRPEHANSGFVDGETIEDVQTLWLGFTDGTSYTISFYNIHNGYYSHNLDIIVNGSVHWNVAI